MATLDHGSVLRDLYAAFNVKDIDRAASHARSDAQMTNVPLGSTMNVRDYIQNWATAFPDAKVDIVTLVAQGDRVVCEFKGTGTHRGPLKTPSGAIAPTNRKVDMRFVEVWEMRDGKISAGRMYFDMATFMNQLGLGAPMATTTPSQPNAPSPRH